MDWSQSSPVDPGPYWAQSASPAWLGVSQTPGLEQESAASSASESRRSSSGGVSKNLPEQVNALQQAYSPELQPCERLWELPNEGVANRFFRTLDDLEVAQAQRCVVLQDQPEMIRSLTHFRLQASLQLKTSVIHRI